MEIRLANIEDIDDIMLVINDARSYLKHQGLLQWNLKDGYPTIETIRKDIIDKNSYVLTNDNTIIGTMTIIIGDDENYNNINGKWLSNAEYAQIHRVAIKR